jgi:NADH pyrophosphatase NudC (nudix superfamily)
MSNFQYCPMCATELQLITQDEDGGPKARMRCVVCQWTHWNNPTPVLGAIVQRGEHVVLARNAAWQGRRFALITGFMEANETPQEGITREIKEETNLDVTSLSLVGVYEFVKKNQVLIVYHAQATGEIRLSPELAEYQLQRPSEIICWPAGTGHAVADWQRSLGIEPRYQAWEDRV